MGEGGRAAFPCPCHHKLDRQWGQLSHVHKFGTGLPTPVLAGLTLLCCPGEVQVLLSQVTVGGRPATLMATGPALPSVVWWWHGWEECIIEKKNLYYMCLNHEPKNSAENLPQTNNITKRPHTIISFSILIRRNVYIAACFLID